MYLKIIGRSIDDINVFLDIQDIKFYRTGETSASIGAAEGGADISIVSQTTYTMLNELRKQDPEKTMDVGHFHITHGNGKKVYIVFDYLAFLCNEQGKAVERYLSSLGAGEKA